MGFGGIMNLRGSEDAVKMEPWMVDELVKCANDPIYFINNYVKIITKDHGEQLFKTWDFQARLIRKLQKYRFNITKFPRQCGKSSTTRGFLLHYAIFNEDKLIAILGNKLSLAKEQLQLLRESYLGLPIWMQPGVVQWNRMGVEFTHGTRIMVSATSTDNIRGLAINLLYIDEFAFVKSHIADEFIASVFPAVSSGSTTKVIITSTPAGMNHFYRMWQDAIEENDIPESEDISTMITFIRSEIQWNEVPGRDEKWLQGQVRLIGEIRVNQEYKCINYEETITIRNKSTGLIETISIGEFYERIRMQNLQ